MAEPLAMITMRLPAELLPRFEEAARVMTEKGTGPKATRSDAVRRAAEMGIVELERELGISASKATTKGGAKPARKPKT
jgi:metal-responsive CopG/Arc/MetJ family transcriptional regulator